MYYLANERKLATTGKSLFNRLYLYTKERFPLAQYGVITALFAFCGLSLSSSLRTGQAHFSLAQFAVAALTTFILFYQLRVADEFKDHTDDCRYAPERPVPRGLVSLRELGSSAVLLALLQLALTSLKPGLWPFLFAIWIYFALMSKEFFIGSWLRQHPVYYMLSHMFILVFSDLFITAVDFVGSSKGPVLLLLFFLTGSFFNGMVIEFGRKIKAPECEREGMESYSRALGLQPAVIALTASVIAAQASLSLALPHYSNFATLVFAVFDCFAFAIFHQFMTKPNLANQKKLDAMSGLLVALSYLTISLISWI
jgi:4-hydroxybenzoate polyprenyltransferase